MAYSAISVELLYAPEVDSASADELARIFTAAGAEVQARQSRPHRGDLGWLVMAAAPLQALLGGLGQALAQDVYEAAKKLLQRRGKPADPRPPLVLIDPGTDLRIAFDADLPAHAFEQLVKLDLSAYKYGPLHYDRHRQAWRSELDESND